MLYKILTVAGLATFEIYAAIPAGFAFGLSPWVIFSASFFGGIIGIIIAAFLGEKIKTWISKFRKPKPVNLEKKPSLALKIWNKFGIIGLGIIGTFTVGAPASLAVGVGINANVKKLAIWCSVGVLLRCIVFTLIGHFSLKAL